MAGLDWLKKKQQLLLTNRTKGTDKFNQTIMDNLKSLPGKSSFFIPWISALLIKKIGYTGPIKAAIFK